MIINKQCIFSILGAFQLSLQRSDHLIASLMVYRWSDGDIFLKKRIKGRLYAKIVGVNLGSHSFLKFHLNFQLFHFGTLFAGQLQILQFLLLVFQVLSFFLSCGYKWLQEMQLLLKILLCLFKLLGFAFVFIHFLSYSSYKETISRGCAP